jgi:LysM repeat protein
MQQIRNHNRDFKNSGSQPSSGQRLPKFFKNIKSTYRILLVLTVAGAAWFSVQKQNQLLYKSDHPVSAQPVEVKPETTDIADSEENISTQKNEPDLAAALETSTEISATPLPTEALTETGSGTTFAPLLEKSPELWKTVKVKRGDTLYIILKRLGLKTAAATLIARTDKQQPQL